MANSLEALLHARSLAIVGISQPGRFGGQIYANLQAFGYPGTVYGVSRSQRELYGQPCYPSLRDLPERPDLAVLALANVHLEAALAEVAELGIPAAVIFASGYLPPEPGRPPLDQRLAQIARDHGIALCGPNGMGFASFHQRLGVAGYPLPADLAPGNIGLIAHSGSVFSSLLRGTRQLGFSYAVSGGNEVVLTLADYARFIVADPATQVLALFLEAVHDPAGFVAVLEQAAARDLPVVALKVGRSRHGQELALAHSGRLAGQAEVYAALFRHYGVCSVYSLDEWADTVELFSRLTSRRAPTRRLATMHDAGGERVLLADMAADLGLEFAPLAETTTARLAAVLDPGLAPENPLDAWGTGQDYQATYAECLRALDADPQVGALALCVDLIRGGTLAMSYVAILRELAGSFAKPFAVLVNMTSGAGEEPLRMLRELGFPLLMGTETGLRALRHLLDYSAFQRERPDLERLDSRQQTPNTQRQSAARWRGRIMAMGGRPLADLDVFELLAEYGITVAMPRLVDSPEQALAAAQDLGFPLALKTAGLAHKSDVGGVALGIRSPVELDIAYRDLAARLGLQALVQPMAPRGVELTLGLTRDPQFGLLLALGLGGIFVEVFHDLRLLLLPTTPALIRRALGELRGAPLLAGVRGQPPADVDAIVAAALGLAALAHDLGDLLEAVDVNPLIVLPEGAVAVDALVVPATTTPAR